MIVSEIFNTNHIRRWSDKGLKIHNSKDGYDYDVAEDWVDEWFAEAKEGDVGQLTTTATSGSTTVTYNVVLYKEAYLDVGWRYVARHDLISSRCTEWYATHSDTLPVTVQTEICRN